MDKNLTESLTSHDQPVEIVMALENPLLAVGIANGLFVARSIDNGSIQ